MTRTLIYAMQSSGASAYTFHIGAMASNHERVLCLPDVWNPYLAFCADRVDADSVIQKVVVTNRYTLDQHIAAFKPTEVILFQREREANRKSLESKSYANENGDIDFKFSLFDAELARKRFQVVGNDEWLEIKPHDLNTMLINNVRISEAIGYQFERMWGFGGIRTS